MLVPCSQGKESSSSLFLNVSRCDWHVFGDLFVMLFNVTGLW